MENVATDVPLCVNFDSASLPRRPIKMTLLTLLDAILPSNVTQLWEIGAYGPAGSGVINAIVLLTLLIPTLATRAGACSFYRKQLKSLRGEEKSRRIGGGNR